MNQELIALKNEIRDLKTAQQRPSIMRLYYVEIPIPQNITKGFHHWTIHYETSENPTEPITFECDFVFIPEFYDANTNTQKIVFDCPYDGYLGGYSLPIFSTRPILSFTTDS